MIADEGASGATSLAADGGLASGYRWIVLGAASVAQASFAAFAIGIPILAPEIRQSYGLTLAQIGVVLTALAIGVLPTVLFWGIAADRFGERMILVIGLGICGLAIVAMSQTKTFPALVGLVALASACGVSVNAASGRAVSAWFPSRELGLAMGLRQTSIPAGGLLAAATAPSIVEVTGLHGALLSLAIFCFVGTAIAGIAVREHPTGRAARGEMPRTRGLPGGRALRIGVACCFLMVPQAALMSFAVLFLTDAYSLSTRAAGAVLGCVYALAIAGRIGTGSWSDRIGERITLLRKISILIFVAVSIVAAFDCLGFPVLLVVPALVVAGGIATSWNGLALVAVAESARWGRTGAAIGMQQTFLSIGGAATPIVFAAVVELTTWWSAFALSAGAALCSWWILRSVGESDPRRHDS